MPTCWKVAQVSTAQTFASLQMAPGTTMFFIQSTTLGRYSSASFWHCGGSGGELSIWGKRLQPCRAGKRSPTSSGRLASAQTLPSTNSTCARAPDQRAALATGRCECVPPTHQLVRRGGVVHEVGDHLRDGQARVADGGALHLGGVHCAGRGEVSADALCPTGVPGERGAAAHRARGPKMRTADPGSARRRPGAPSCAT